MKKILCVLVVLCFCLVGFTVGMQSADLYLQNNESIYIARNGNYTYVWVYTLNPVTGQWDLKEVKELNKYIPRINVHFVEPLVFQQIINQNQRRQ